ncbi:hypothetical protein KAR10_02820 [bacterium]|nr:hypothetical protein [bacterium]
MISLAKVLEWKYGPVSGTKQKDTKDKSPNPGMIISYWNHPTLQEPSEERLAADFLEYEAYITDKNNKKKAIEDEFTDLKKSLKGKNKSEIKDSEALEFIKLKMALELEMI